MRAERFAVLEGFEELLALLERGSDLAGLLLDFADALDEARVALVF